MESQQKKSTQEMRSITNIELISTVTKQTPYIILLLFPIRGVNSLIVTTVIKPLFLFCGLMNQREIIVPYHRRVPWGSIDLERILLSLYHNQTIKEETDKNLREIQLIETIDQHNMGTQYQPG